MSELIQSIADKREAIKSLKGDAAVALQQAIMYERLLLRKEIAEQKQADLAVETDRVAAEVIAVTAVAVDATAKLDDSAKAVLSDSAKVSIAEIAVLIADIKNIKEAPVIEPASPIDPIKESL